MEKSIETIWAKGFDDDKNLSAPKIDRHYAKKSKIVIEKMKRTMEIDNKSLIPLAVVLLGGFLYFDYLILGLFLATVVVILYFFNRKVFDEFKKIDFKTTTLEYLKSYINITLETQKLYTKLVGIGLPLVALPSYWLYFKDFEKYNMIIDKLSVPVIVTIIMSTAIVLSLLGVLMYKLSVRVLYSKNIARLEQMIIELNDLPNG